MSVPVDEKLIKAGDYELESLVIHTIGNNGVVDLTNFFIELHLFEDIFSPSLTGKIVIADALNLIVSLPIIGDEAITLKMRTPTLSDDTYNVIEKTFNLYAIKDRISNNDGSQFYTLCFTSIEDYLDTSQPISKTFRGTTDEVAAQVFEDHIKTERVLGKPDFTPLLLTDTPHRSKIVYTSNYWTPFKNMRFISKRVRGKSLNGSDYLFFESNKNFYFSSIESLIQTQLTKGLFDEYVLERDSQSIPRRKTGFDFYGNLLPDAMTRIEDMKYKKSIDMLDSQQVGLLSSSIYGYDLATKKFVQRDLDYVNEVKNFYRTDIGNPFPSETPRNPRNKVSFIMYNSSVFPDYGLTDNENLPQGHPAEYYSDRFLFRQSYLNGLNQYTFEMTVPGRTDIEVGCAISVLYPASGAKDTETKDIDTIFDPSLSGVFFVTAIHHKFNIDRHVMTLELIKNGLGSDLGVYENAAT